MKRRGVKQSDSSSSEVRRTAKAKKTEGTPWLKRGLLALVVISVLVPVSLTVLPGLIQHFVYTYRIRVPFFVDLSRPADYSLNHTINMYLTTEEGISLGIWHTVPESRWKEAQGKDLAWYQNTLSDGSPVFLYLHGNLGTRRRPHRVGVSKILSALGYHVLMPDYRGFADSTGEPTEDGMTSDTVYLYNWIKARCGNCMVSVWGHSLGTGVSTNTELKLNEQGASFGAVILEGTFHAARQPKPLHPQSFHPFSWYYWKFPGHGYFFPEPWANNKVVFPTMDNLKKMSCPILFLHTEDDNLTPLKHTQEMYEAAVSAQNAERVKMVTFEGSLGYLHNGIYQDPRLPDIIKKFMLSL